jgi:hypothetical protein
MLDQTIDDEDAHMKIVDDHAENPKKLSRSLRDLILHFDGNNLPPQIKSDLMECTLWFDVYAPSLTNYHKRTNVYVSNICGSSGRAAVWLAILALLVSSMAFFALRVVSAIHAEVNGSSLPAKEQH